MRLSEKCESGRVSQYSVITTHFLSERLSESHVVTHPESRRYSSQQTFAWGAGQLARVDLTFPGSLPAHRGPWLHLRASCDLEQEASLSADNRVGAGLPGAALRRAMGWEPCQVPAPVAPSCPSFGEYMQNPDSHHPG